MSTNNCTLAEELRMLREEFRNKFSIPHLQELAYQTGMIRRKRKFRAQDLVSLCVFLDQTVSSESLVRLCTELNEATGICISEEALNKRWNERTVQFFKELFLHAFRQKICPVAPLASRFTRIRILDSTSFQLPPSYASTYRGNGGESFEAGVKIQLEYDLLSGEFMELEVDYGVSNDARYGQLLRLCLVASITYQMRRLLWEKQQKEASEMKCAYMVQIYLIRIHAALFCTSQHPVSVLTKLFQDVKRNGRKARRCRKASFTRGFYTLYNFSI
ncbi:transposase [Ectobacillus funiculus]|uniref:Transposase n=1 Tax=Ectobacillus funiculus TaxID=137993 RepID=A0ABV5WI38_9BACI